MPEVLSQGGPQSAASVGAIRQSTQEVGMNLNWFSLPLQIGLGLAFGGAMGKVLASVGKWLGG